MLLCDIGNTSYHFFDGEENFKESVEAFDPITVKEKVYYISVNTKVNIKLANLVNWIDLSDFIAWDKYYPTMGIDRVIACEMIENGVIVDAGSAITVDIVKDGIFQGGFIYPGVRAMQKTYETISPALQYAFNFDLSLDSLAKNSQDAISYGYLQPLYREVTSYELPIILTGGDAKKFLKIFQEADLDELLLFKGMQKIIQRSNL